MRHPEFSEKSNPRWRPFDRARRERFQRLPIPCRKVLKHFWLPNASQHRTEASVLIKQGGRCEISELGRLDVEPVASCMARLAGANCHSIVTKLPLNCNTNLSGSARNRNLSWQGRPYGSSVGADN